MPNKEMLGEEEIGGWLVEKIQKISSHMIKLENSTDISILELGLDSVELIELVNDFETKFDCKIITDQFIEIESLSDLKKFMHKAAVRSLP